MTDGQRIWGSGGPVTPTFCLGERQRWRKEGRERHGRLSPGLLQEWLAEHGARLDRLHTRDYWPRILHSNATLDSEFYKTVWTSLPVVYDHVFYSTATQARWSHWPFSYIVNACSSACIEHLNTDVNTPVRLWDSVLYDSCDTGQTTTLWSISYCAAWKRALMWLICISSLWLHWLD